MISRPVHVQYKNIAQNTSVGSIEVVINKFVQLADAKVQEAQEKADKAVALTDVDDLEASETPESILLGAVSGDQSKDRTDRALVTVRIPATSYLVPLFTLIYLVLFHLLPPYHLDVPCYLNNRQRYCSVWSERLGPFTHF